MTKNYKSLPAGHKPRKKRTMLDFMIQTRQKIETGESWWCRTRPFVPNMKKKNA